MAVEILFDVLIHGDGGVVLYYTKVPVEVDSLSCICIFSLTLVSTLSNRWGTQA